MVDFRWFIHWFQTVVLIYFMTINSLYLLFTIISFRQLYYYLLSLYFDRQGSYIYQPITILVPARNEEMTIVHNVSALLNLGYPQYEIIVVDDGSDDGTSSRLVEKFNMVPFEKVCRKMLETEPVQQVFRSISHPNLYVLNKEAGGKADALNVGINYSAYPLFCSLDADSILEPDALLRASRLFAEDSTLIAVGGMVRVVNGSQVEEGRITNPGLPGRLIERFQVIEYIRGFLTGRTAWSAFGSLMIISGAFSLLRKDAVLEVDGYHKLSITEDMDLIVRLHRHFREARKQYKMLFVPDPICWTQVPSSWRSLLRQRNRWQRGLVATLWENKRMMLRPSYGEVGLLGYPYFVVFEAFGPTIELLGYVAVVGLYMFGELSTKFAILFFMVAIVYGALLNIGSVLLENFLFRRYARARDFLLLVLVSLVEFFGYRQILSVERVIASFQRRLVHWGKPARQAFDE